MWLIALAFPAGYSATGFDAGIKSAGTGAVAEAVAGAGDELVGFIAGEGDGASERVGEGLTADGGSASSTTGAIGSNDGPKPC